MRDNPTADAWRACVNSLVPDKSGSASAAVAAVHFYGPTSPALRVELDKGMPSPRVGRQTSSVMLTVMNETNSGVSVNQALHVFVNASRTDIAHGMGQQLRCSMCSILNWRRLSTSTQPRADSTVSRTRDAAVFKPPHFGDPRRGRE